MQPKRVQEITIVQVPSHWLGTIFCKYQNDDNCGKQSKARTNLCIPLFVFQTLKLITSPFTLYMLNSNDSKITCLLSSVQFVRCQQEPLIYNKLIATFLATTKGMNQVTSRAYQELQMALNPSLVRFILKNDS